MRMFKLGWVVGCLCTVLSVALLSGCVTETTTTGGAELEADESEALSRRVELARQYIGRGDWDNAKRNLELASDIDSDNAEVYEAFGLVYQSTGEYDRAESSFRRALKIDPEFSRGRNNFAAFLFFLGRFEEAEREFARVCEDPLYTGRPLAYINLGLSRLRLDDAPGAEAAFVRALRMDRTNVTALLELGYLKLAGGEIKAAKSYYGVYQTILQRQPPRGLILGLEIALAEGDKNAASSYDLALRNLYGDSPEYQRYLQQRQQQP